MSMVIPSSEAYVHVHAQGRDILYKIESYAGGHFASLQCSSDTVDRNSCYPNGYTHGNRHFRHVGATVLGM